MFTIKFYRGARIRIFEAESFTILKAANGEAEITMHRKDSAESFRVDIGHVGEVTEVGVPDMYEKAIIENSAGRTTEIISVNSVPR